jgi:hypothetical protein
VHDRLQDTLAGVNRVKTDIAAHLLSVEVDLFGNLIGTSLCHPNGIAESGYAKYTAAAGYDFSVFESGSGMKHVTIVAIRQ